MTKPKPGAKSGGRKAAEPPPRRGRAEAVGALLPSVGGMAFRRFGFAQGALLGRWSEVVGPLYARWSVPESIRFPRGEKSGGTLTVRVEGPFAVQLQHVSPQIIERVNRIFGYAVVARLKLVQGEVPKAAARPASRPSVDAAPSPDLRNIADHGLRSALEALAREVAAGSAPDGMRKVR